MTDQIPSASAFSDPFVRATLAGTRRCLHPNLNAITTPAGDGVSLQTEVGCEACGLSLRRRFRPDEQRQISEYKHMEDCDVVEEVKGRFSPRCDLARRMDLSSTTRALLLQTCDDADQLIEYIGRLERELGEVRTALAPRFRGQFSLAMRWFSTAAIARAIMADTPPAASDGRFDGNGRRLDEFGAAAGTDLLRREEWEEDDR